MTSVADVLQDLADRFNGEPPPGMMFVPDPIINCDECSDVRWVKMAINSADRVDGGADHYMNPCSQCLPDRYDVMVRQNCGERDHQARGGCIKCRKYTRPWNNGK